MEVTARALSISPTSFQFAHHKQEVKLDRRLVFPKSTIPSSTLSYGHACFPSRFLYSIHKCEKRFLAKSSSSTTVPSIERRSSTQELVVDYNNESCGNDPSISSQEFSVVADIFENCDIEMEIKVSGTRTQKIFDDVFSKLVEAAQPIPGFRRVKGGKTPNIPKDVLLHIIGPTKVYGQAIREIISSTVAEYVDKEGIKVTKDLKVRESYDELEAAFEPGKALTFNACLPLQNLNSSNVR